MKAFAYIRVSGKGQVEGDGPDRQREKILAFCKANILEHSGEAFEQGVSGTVDAFDRPAFVDLISQIGNAVIVVERMDRLARDLMVQEMLLSECRKRGIRVYAADQGFVDVANDGGDPSRTLIRQIFGAIAQWEKSVIVLKTRSARDRVRKATGRCEGVKPYGELPGEAAVLRLINAATASHRNIAEVLNQNGFTTRHGQPWTKKHVANVLQTQRKNHERRKNTADNQHQQ